VIIPVSSEKKLKSVHPDMLRVVRRVAADWKAPGPGWIITGGPRTIEEQKLLVAKGASRTMRSRHIPAANGFSHAVDFACTIKGVLKWDWPLYSRLAVSVKAAAKAEKVTIEWGGDWAKFRDGPHFQLPWASYPGTK